MPGIENKTDAQWEAEGDARTLSAANIILNDDKRWNAAKKAAANLAKEISSELEGLLKIAGKGTKVEGMNVISKD